MMPMRDEAGVFARETATMRGGAPGIRGDAVAVATTFKAVVLEGLEVVFIVLAIGAPAHMIVPAVLGAAAAGVFLADWEAQPRLSRGERAAIGRTTPRRRRSWHPI